MIVTLIADNYFGYCKKEVKTQISYAANLLGNVEEEHSGGALAFASYNLGDDFDAEELPPQRPHARRRGPRRPGGRSSSSPRGYAVDRRFPDLVYIPADARASVQRLQVWWTQDGREVAIPLAPGKIYMTPSGYKVHLEKHPGAASWRLIGTVAEGLFCHKPCTVSGGGKSEISKSLRDYMIYGPIFVADLDKDFDLVQQIFDHDYSDRWKPGRGPGLLARAASRPVLSPRALAGQRDQAADPLGRLHRRVQRLAGVVPQLHLPDRLHHQAVRRRRDARALARAVRRRQHQRLPRATS